jgi:gliding motility-associated-like protein
MESTQKKRNVLFLCTHNSARLPLSAFFEGAQYLWQDGTTNDHYVIHQQGIYWVTVSNSCFSTSDTVIADYVDCSSCVHYPTAFSPDGSGQNDLFHPLITCPVTSYTFRVYNRWGQLIFETNDANAGWDGKYKGEASGIGVYVWYVDYHGIRSGQNFSQKVSGNVTLVR